jgi:hypothetical protein
MLVVRLVANAPRHLAQQLDPIDGGGGELAGLIRLPRPQGDPDLRFGQRPPPLQRAGHEVAGGVLQAGTPLREEILRSDEDRPNHLTSGNACPAKPRVNTLERLV